MKISIIIPTHNRSCILKKTLSDMCGLLTMDIQWELLVVDNASSDATKEIVYSFKDSLPVRYLYAAIPGKNCANNVGLSESLGEILIFTDDDISPRENWLCEVIAACARFPNCNVFGGRVIAEYPKGTAQYLKESWYTGFVFGNHDFGENDQEYAPMSSPGGANCWMRRQVFADGHVFDERIGPAGPKGQRPLSGSELEFFERLRAKGERMIYAPKAVVHHRVQASQTTLKYLLRRGYASGRGFVYIFLRKETSKSWFNIPRYLFRQIGEALLKASVNSAILRWNRVVDELMVLAKLFGVAVQFRIERAKRYDE